MPLARSFAPLILATAIASCAGPGSTGKLGEEDPGSPPRTYSGCVRQLDASAGDGMLQAIVNASPSDQLVVQVPDLALQALAMTAFVWDRSVHVTYREGSPNVAVGLTLERRNPSSCDLEADPGQPESRYCLLRLDGDARQRQFLATLADSRTNSTVEVRVEHPTLQGLLETAFVWNRQVYVYWDRQQVATRVKLDRFFTDECRPAPPDRSR